MSCLGVAFTVVLIAACSIVAANAFSAAAPRQFIDLSNQSDKLPASFVKDWPTYVLDQTGDLVKIPHDNGFVVPTCIDELWQPQDLKQPQCRLALGFHVRNGEFRHVFPAMDLSFDGGNQHRNRGLCTVPRAYQWMEFSSLVVGDGLQDCLLSLSVRETNDNEDNEWKPLMVVDSIETEINLAIEALANDPPKELEDGSFILHVVCANGDESVTCPKPGNEIRALLLENDNPVGILQVTIEGTAAGSESEYLPEAYKPLFLDESLKRPAFVEAKKRMEKRTNNENRIE